MDLLIKNMEMPKSCETCQLATVTYYNTWCPLTKSFMKRGYSFKDCPLVEVPPHGELCDKDKLKEEAGGTYQWSQAIEAIKNAPVVLEATE